MPKKKPSTSKSPRVKGPSAKPQPKANREVKGARKAAQSPKATTRALPRSSKASMAIQSGGGATLPCYQIDAFTKRLFHGNPAAVVICDRDFPPAEVMLAVAAEHNLSETAFIAPPLASQKPKGKAAGNTIARRIRWFSPMTEVDLCGHATLASAHALWAHQGAKAERIVFHSMTKGALPVDRLDHLYVLDFPAMDLKPVKVTPLLCRALGAEPVEAFMGRDLMAVFDNRRTVYQLKPDFALLSQIEAFGVIATAPGSGHDFVSRCFYPRAGVNEDPVTGSAHCMLAPFWARTLGKTLLTAHQVSHRSGELLCELVGSLQDLKSLRVRLGGQAVTYSQGTISLGS